MSRHLPTPFLGTTAIALVTGALLVGCEQRTTTTETPTGSTSTTTVSPSASASAGMDRVGDAASDAALTTKVKTALLADDNVKGLQIDVDTKDGVVTLNGTADSPENVTRAETVAKGVDGVKSVENRLTATAASTTSGSTAATATGAAGTAASGVADSVGRAADRAGDSASAAMASAGDAIGDAAVTAKVKTAFLADTDVKGLQIDVDTKDGIVTLTGTLEKQENVQRAEDIAKRIDGVKSVQNKLTVKSS